MEAYLLSTPAHGSQMFEFNGPCCSHFACLNAARTRRMQCVEWHMVHAIGEKGMAACAARPLLTDGRAQSRAAVHEKRHVEAAASNTAFQMRTRHAVASVKLGSGRTLTRGCTTRFSGIRCGLEPNAAPLGKGVDQRTSFAVLFLLDHV